MYTIGEVANLKGLTVKALRYYEKIGLLEPHFIDPANNYRYYSKEQFILIDIIKGARSLEISPKDLVPFFSNQNSDRIMAYLKTYKKEIKDRMLSFEKMLLQIKAVEHAYCDAHGVYKETDVYVREIPSRGMVTTALPEKLDDRSISTVYDRLDAAVNQQGLIHTYKTGILLTADKNGFKPSKLVMMVNRDEPVHKNNHETIEGGDYVCINYKKEDVEKQQSKLTRYLQKNKITPKIILQMDLLIDFFEKDTQYFELQVLI